MILPDNEELRVDAPWASVVRFTAVLAGVATLALGLIVLVGWHVGNRTLIQVLPQFVPMQYNTALGFAFSGLALTMLAVGRPGIAIFFGGITSLIGGLTLVEYICGVSLGIDELFMVHSITTKTSHPGRMAPNTAVCFLLFGVASILGWWRWNAIRFSMLTVVLGSLTFGLAVVALSGYLAQLETAYGWGNLTRMAVHTSIGFIVASLGLLCWIWSGEDGAHGWLPRWIPIPTAVGVLTAALSLWQAVAAEGQRIHQQHEDVTSLSSLATIILVVGTLLAVALSLVVYLAQRAAVRSVELQTHRDLLEETVKERTGELEQSLDKSKQYAAELNRSRSLIHGLLDATDSVIYVKDLDGRYILVNEEWSRVVARSSEATIGLTDFDFQPQGVAQALVDNDRLVVDGRKAVRFEETPDDGPDARTFLSNKFPLFDAEGKVYALGGISTDISELKRQGEALQQARHDADEANRAKSDFLANMSHEIRTPMNGIMGMTELALGTELNKEQREFLVTIESSAESLLSLINDILDFSKIEAKKLELDPTEFELRERIGETLSTLAARVHDKGLELAFEIDHDVPELLMGDVHRIRQILINLLGNAIKFTEQGEILLRINLVRQTEQTVMLRFAVSDTGIGLAAEKLQTIFQPFEQADVSTTRKYGGTGLGLAICVRLVELMEGEMSVESELGSGTTFSFTAELGFGSQSSKKPSAVPIAQLQGLHVLVVDDNQTNRRILTVMLENWGMRPVAVDSAAKGLEVLQSSHRGDPIGLVLSDVNMPEMDGFSFASEIVSQTQWRNTPIILLTSANRSGDGARCREIGISAHLIKPARQSLLFDAIATSVGAGDTIDAKANKEGAAENITQAASDQATSGLQLLLAEDNEINQKFAVRALSKAGHTVKVVPNGRDAVDAWEADSFDAILMDIQMPVMDGYLATAEIRRREASSPRHTPIIAMTAHAMKGDKEKCLDAGMDGYVTKPIKSKLMLAEISRVLREVRLDEDSDSPQESPDDGHH